MDYSSFVWLSLGFDFGTAAKNFERNLRHPFTPPLVAILVLQKVFKLVEDATPGTIRSSIDKVVCKFYWEKRFFFERRNVLEFGFLKANNSGGCSLNCITNYGTLVRGAETMHPRVEMIQVEF